jgi:hypothetical protein
MIGTSRLYRRLRRIRPRHLPFAKGVEMKSMFMLAFILAAVSTSASAASFYPACLKPDGDWLHGVTRKECVSRDIKGRWYTNSMLKKARRVM